MPYENVLMTRKSRQYCNKFKRREEKGTKVDWSCDDRERNAVKLIIYWWRWCCMTKSKYPLVGENGIEYILDLNECQSYIEEEDDDLGPVFVCCRNCRRWDIVDENGENELDIKRIDINIYDIHYGREYCNFDEEDLRYDGYVWLCETCFEYVNCKSSKKKDCWPVWLWNFLSSKKVYRRMNGDTSRLWQLLGPIIEPWLLIMTLITSSSNSSTANG